MGTPGPLPTPTLCVDIGSTWTKTALVGARGELVGQAQHPTSRPDVLAGVEATARTLRAGSAATVACSSAGGGLRLAVLGQERLISAEAGYRVALSSGARVVHVGAGELDEDGWSALAASAPDVLLLTGGTDGGDTTTLLHNADWLGRFPLSCPVVLAGNAAVAEQAAAALRVGHHAVVTAANVLPDIGELAPDSARGAIRGVFLDHVIGHKGLSRNPRLGELVRTVTPDAVRVGVSRLAAALTGPDRGAVLVVDVGGATTDVYSADADRERGTPEQHVVGLPEDRRTVEGDLGMRSSAGSLVAEAHSEQLVGSELDSAAAYRGEHPEFVPAGAVERVTDARLGALAAVLGIRRHLRLLGGSLGPRGVQLLVLSGGVFRHADRTCMSTVEQTLRGDPMLRAALKNARITVDTRYLLAPAGLLAAAGRTETADTLLAHQL